MKPGSVLFYFLIAVKLTFAQKTDLEVSFPNQVKQSDNFILVRSNFITEGYDTISILFKKMNKNTISFSFNLNIPSHLKIINVSKGISVGPRIYIAPKEKRKIIYYWSNDEKRVDELSNINGENKVYPILIDSLWPLVQHFYKNISKENFSASEISFSKKFDDKAKKIINTIRKQYNIDNYYWDNYINPQLRATKFYAIISKYQELGVENPSLLGNYIDEEFLKKIDFSLFDYSDILISYVREVFKILFSPKQDCLNQFLSNINQYYYDPICKTIAMAIGFYDYKLNLVRPLSVEEKNTVKKLIYDNYEIDFAYSEAINFIVKDFTIFDSLFFEDAKGNIYSFSILFKDTSRVYFIDVWASWCKPCIEALPFTKTIEEKQIKNFEVVYLSVDEDELKWKGLSERMGISTQNSFRLNRDSKSLEIFRKYFKTEALPLYKMFYYNKSHNLVYTFHPSEWEKIKMQIDYILKY